MFSLFLDIIKTLKAKNKKITQNPKYAFIFVTKTPFMERGDMQVIQTGSVGSNHHTSINIG